MEPPCWASHSDFRELGVGIHPSATSAQIPRLTGAPFFNLIVRVGAGRIVLIPHRTRPRF